PNRGGIFWRCLLQCRWCEALQDHFCWDASPPRHHWICRESLRQEPYSDMGRIPDRLQRKGCEAIRKYRRSGPIYWPWEDRCQAQPMFCQRLSIGSHRTWTTELDSRPETDSNLAFPQ